MLFRKTEINAFSKILVAYDGIRRSQKVLEFGIDLAKKYNSQLFIVEVTDETIFRNS